MDRDRGIIPDPSYMYLGQLDTTLVVVSLDGKEVMLDPGEKMCPFQTLNWRHSGAMGLRQSDKGLEIVTQPRRSNMPPTLPTRTGDITLDAHGGVTGTVTIAMNGQVALRWRQDALRNDEDEVKKQFDRGLEQVVPDGIGGTRISVLQISDEAHMQICSRWSLQGFHGSRDGQSEC